MGRQYRKKLVAAALRRAGLEWEEYNNGLHWIVRKYKLHIWPTTLRTRNSNQVIKWQTIESLEAWLKDPPPPRSGDTKPIHDLPLYSGDIPPWDNACLEWRAQ